MDLGVPQQKTPRPRDAAAGRVQLAVVVVDADGLVSHWSTGARKLFGVAREDAIGCSAGELLPVAGALRDHGEPSRDGMYAEFGPELDSSLSGVVAYPTAGRARVDQRDRGRIEVLWWAYPLVGPGPERLLVLAADSAQLRGGEGAEGRNAETIAPGFALHTDFPGYLKLSGRLSEILPSMSVQEATRIVSQVLELGYPVLEFSHHDRIPVTPDWGVPQRSGHRTSEDARRIADGQLAPRAVPRPELDLEYAAVRERLEFLNEVSGRIGTSLDLERTIREVTSAAVPRFTDFAGTHLRAAVLAGEGFPDGPPDVTTVWHRVWVEHNDEPGRWDDTVPVGEPIAFPEHTPFFQCMVTGEPVIILMSARS